MKPHNTGFGGRPSREGMLEPKHSRAAAATHTNKTATQIRPRGLYLVRDACDSAGAHGGATVGADRPIRRAPLVAVKGGGAKIETKRWRDANGNSHDGWMRNDREFISNVCNSGNLSSVSP